MKLIGKRISVVEKDNELSIVILGTDNKVKRTLLFLWLFAWSVCGLIVLTEFFRVNDEKTKVALLVWFGFWLYFEYKVARAFMWRKFGKEKIWTKSGKLFIKRDISGRGKTGMYEVDFIKDLRMSEPTGNDFTKTINQSFWVIAGERLAFDYYGREIRFGIQLDDHSASELLKTLQHHIRSLAIK